ncbi:MAG TPA: hypothetical protein EYO73_06085 [Sulfurimonas sp.]|nr:hypothetical protein [Sulfurimonas sp.]
MTKAQQVSSTRIKPKKESTFGKTSNGNFGKSSKGSFGKVSRGSFGKKQSNGDFGKGPSKGSFGKERLIIKSKPKVKVEELSYLQWLHEDAQLHTSFCMVCNRPVQDWHHVKLTSTDKKNHKRLIPLCKAHHVGNALSPHGTPALWRETYSMSRQNKIADEVYNRYISHMKIFN